MTWAICSARDAKKSRVSVKGTMSSASSIARIFSPRTVPPGSRVRTARIPFSRKNASQASIWEVFPAPSMPSNVIKRPRPFVSALIFVITRISGVPTNAQRRLR